MSDADEPPFMDWYMQVREGLEKRAVPEQVARILDVLLRLSFCAPTPASEARVYRLDLLAAAAKITNFGNLSKVLNAGEKARLYRRRDERVKRRVGQVMVTCVETIFELKPDWRQWQLPDRFTDEVTMRSELAMAALLDARDSDQATFGFQRPRDLEDGFVAVSREPGDSGGSVRESFDIRSLREPLVPGTTGCSLRAGCDAVQPFVPGTSGVSDKGTTEENEGVVPGTSGSPFKALKVPAMEPLNFKGAGDSATMLPREGEKQEGAAVAAGESRAASPMARMPSISTDDLDFALVDRMERALGPEQMTKYGKLWLKRAAAAERPMRVTVDSFFDRDRGLPKIAVNWQWILDGYISRAVEMGMSERLLPCDQEFLRKKLAGNQTRWKQLGKLLREGVGMIFA